MQNNVQNKTLTLEQLGYTKQENEQIYYKPTDERQGLTQPSEPHKTIQIDDSGAFILYTFNKPANQNEYQLAGNEAHILTIEELAALCGLMSIEPNGTLEDLEFTKLETANVYYKPTFRNLTYSGYQQAYTMLVLGPQIKIISTYEYPDEYYYEAEPLVCNFVKLRKEELAALSALVNAEPNASQPVDQPIDQSEAATDSQPIDQPEA